MELVNPDFFGAVGRNPGASFVAIAQRIDGVTAGQAIATDAAPESIGRKTGCLGAIEGAMHSEDASVATASASGDKVRDLASPPLDSLLSCDGDR